MVILHSTIVFVTNNDIKNIAQNTDITNLLCYIIFC